MPIVAELPTCQNIWEDLAPPLRITPKPDEVVRVDPIWKIQTAFVSPPASRVSVPVSPIEEDALYTPGVRVRPPRSPEMVEVVGAPAAVLYAVANRLAQPEDDWRPFEDKIARIRAMA